MNKDWFVEFEKVRPELKGVKSYTYAKRAILGEGIFSSKIILAAERFIKDLQRDDLIFDLDEVELVNEFWAERLYIPELKKPLPLQEPHAFWIEQLYGFKYKSTGLRRFKSVYIQIARKNLKTFQAAGVTLYEAILGNDDFAEILHGANSRDQAIICTDKTGKIIKASPELKSLVETDNFTLHTYKKKVNEIVYETDDRFCRIEAMPKDPGDGGNPSVGIVDEFHEAKDTALLETIESGQGQRKEPLTLVITSPGSNKYGPCFQILRRKAVDTLEGKVEADRLLAILFELDKEEEWDDLEMLEKSNPMIPYIDTIKPYLADRIKDAHLEGGAKRANIIIKNSGIWIDAPKIWIPSATIKKNNHGVTPDHLMGMKCYTGIDLSAGKDLNAVGHLFPNVEWQGRFIMAFLCRFYIPQAKIDAQRNDEVDYLKFKEDGWLTVFNGNVVEYNKIAEDVIEDNDRFDIQSIGCDPKYLYTGITSHLVDRSDISEKIMPVAQGFTALTGPTEMVEQWTAKYEMDFMGNPVLEMCFANTTIHTKDTVSESGGGISGHKFPSKGKSRGRIDGVITVVNSAHEYLRLSTEPPAETPKIEIW